MKYVRCDRCGKEERLDLNRMAELRILKQEAGMKKVFGTNETGSNYLEFVKPYIEKALNGHKGCEETTKDPGDELVEMAQELIVDMTYKGATKAELVRAIKYSKELIDWLKTPAGGYVKTGSPTELLEKYGIAELRKKYQKG